MQKRLAPVLTAIVAASTADAGGSIEYRGIGAVESFDCEQ
jgi:hypothetical protein